jgi:hypothetical protein
VSARNVVDVILHIQNTPTTFGVLIARLIMFLNIGGYLTGPIPAHLTDILGIKFDRIEIGTNRRIIHDIENRSDEWINSWP